MNEVKNIIRALREATILIPRKKLWYFFVPGILISLLFLLLYGGIEGLFSMLNFIEKTPWLGRYLISARDLAFGWTVGTGAFLYQFIILTLFSPFNTYFSEKLDQKITGQVFPFSVIKFIRDFIRLLGILFVGLVFYSLFYSLWLLLAKLVGLQFLTPFVSFIITSFFTGFNSYDYSLERYNIRNIASWKYAFQNPTRMILVGMLYSGLVFVPFIGMIVAPILSMVVATLIYLDERKNKMNA